MKKKKITAAIYAGIILWVVAFLQIGLTKWLCSEDQITQAFSRNQLTITQGMIECKAKMGNKCFDEKALRKQFGKDFTVSYAYADGEKYGHLKLQRRSDFASLWKDKEKLKKMCDGVFGEDNYSLSASASGTVSRMLSDGERSHLANTIRKQLGSVSVKQLENKQYYIDYSYGPGLGSDAVTVEGKRANLNLAIVTDKESKVTRVYMGTPLISEDY